MKKVLAILLAVCMLFLVACTDASKNPTNTAEKSTETEAQEPTATPDAKLGPFDKYDELVTFTLGAVKHNGTLPEGDTFADNAFTRYIEEKVNVRAEIAWEVDWGAYPQRISLAITSNDLPDTFMVEPAVLDQLVDAGMVADLTSAYETTASPLIKEMYDSFNGTILPFATYDDKMMALPGTSIGGQHQIAWLRQDWLDKLNIEAPKTIADLENVARQFVENDPDGNGKDDTVGIPIDPTVAGAYGLMNGIDPIFNSMGSFPRQWIKDANGNVVYGTTTPETRAALEYVSRLYKDKLIDQQFAVRKAGEDITTLIASGQSGIMFAPWYAPYWPLNQAIENNADADWKGYLLPLDENDSFYTYEQNPINMFQAVNVSYDKPEAIIKMMNVSNQSRYGLDPDALEMITKDNGTAGVWPIGLQIDYNDAVYRSFLALDEAVKNNDPSNLRYDYKMMYDAVVLNNENPKGDMSKWGEAVARYEGQSLTFTDNIVVQPVAFHGTTETMALKWATLKKMEDEMFLKIIMGEETIESFDKFVTEWKKLGGDEITQEVMDSLK